MKTIFFCVFLSVSLLIPSLSQDDKTTFTDIRDGHIYRTVKIGDQTWMAENLAYLPKIDQVEDGVFDIERFWVYNYYGNNTEEAINTESYKKYGALYNWPAANKVCPQGWHMPVEKEWQHMEIFLRMEHGMANTRKWRPSGDVGKKLKSVKGWYAGSGTDETGFSALPGGCRGYNGFESQGFCGFFWTGSSSNRDNGWRRTICFDEDGIEKNEDRKYFGCSVRCIKD